MSNSKLRSIRPEDLLLIKSRAEVQLSPGGGCVAYTLTEPDAENDEYRIRIWAVPPRGREPTQLTHGAKPDAAPCWSPDGTRLAFLSRLDGDAGQLYVVNVNCGEAHKLTALEDGAGPALWSPDGTRILSATHVLNSPVVYLWVDGIYVKAGLEKEKACMLVALAGLSDGSKVFVGLQAGYRESTPSWSGVLRGLKQRGMNRPRLVIGDGHLGIWAALRQV